MYIDIYIYIHAKTHEHPTTPQHLIHPHLISSPPQHPTPAESTARTRDAALPQTYEELVFRSGNQGVDLEKATLCGAPK